MVRLPPAGASREIDKQRTASTAQHQVQFSLVIGAPGSQDGPAVQACKAIKYLRARCSDTRQARRVEGYQVRLVRKQPVVGWSVLACFAPE